MRALGLFRVAVVIGFVVMLPAGKRGQRRRETPLEILQRRYAAGEITDKEYEERKRMLERNAQQMK